MASVSWTYPASELLALKKQRAEADVTAGTIADAGINIEQLKFRYLLEGDAPWRPLRVFDDGAKVYIQFPSGLAQSEAPPLFVIGPDARPALVNYRVRGTTYIVDRLFAAAELRLGTAPQRIVRIIRTDAVWRERLQADALDLDLLAAPGIAPPHHLVDEATVSGEIFKVARATQQKLIGKRPLQVAVRAFDGAVLVRKTGVVAGGLHAVVGDQRLVALRQVLARLRVEIAERRQQAIGAVLLGHPAQRPQRVLQALGQRHEALPTEHHVRVLEAREGQAEVVEPVIERLAGNADVKLAHVGEV
jgi:hypothetical protein